MYLRQLEIVGFRGINRLSFRLRTDMVLIGENAWGKSSLLALLSLIFNPEQPLYRFTRQDFYCDNDGKCRRHLMLLFTFCESEKGESRTRQNRRFCSVFMPHDDGFSRIYLKVSGEIGEQGQIRTEYRFLDGNGMEIGINHCEKTVRSLIARHPVYRFRDARLNENPRTFKSVIVDKNDRLQAEIGDEIRAVALLVQYYFFDRRSFPEQQRNTEHLWHLAKQLASRLKQDQNNTLKKALFGSLAQLFQGADRVRTGKYTHPIILFEGLESRLHPRMVAILWELASYLPLQRIITTNSVELLAQVDLRSICRLQHSPERTLAHQLSSRSLGRADLRRLHFHIHHNRSLALFARFWILVEGETEVWILNELAQIMGIDLAMEGIRIVEFAQLGLRPLIKYARAMGIEWYVLTDGDDAGHKYRDTVKAMLHAGEPLSSRLTTLPKSDIEHFFYRNGFSEVFIRLARWQPQGNSYPINKIIKRAIQLSSKPDLAIALSQEIEQRGVQSVPYLFKRLFARVLAQLQE